MSCHGRGSVVDVRKMGVPNAVVRPIESPDSRAVSTARLSKASPSVRDRAAASRGGRAEAPVCFMDSAREGTNVSKRRNTRLGISHRTVRMAVIPINSMRRGEWLRTRVDQVI